MGRKIDIHKVYRKKPIPWRNLATWVGLFLMMFTVLGMGLVSTHQVTAEPKNLQSKDVPITFSETSALGVAGVPELSLRKISDTHYENSRTIETPSTDAAFPFNGLGVSWKSTTPHGTSVSWEMQTYNGFYWSEWETLAENEDLFDSENNTAYTDMGFVEPAKSFRLRVTLRTSINTETPIISVPVAHYLDSRPGVDISETSLNSQGVTLDPKIITRASWGADESLMTWPPEYATPKKFVVHHTAGSLGGNNPASVVRGIYHYHAVTRGWGDIGYNYIVDENGNIFEGRKGGNGVIGAHAQSYNDGSIGISVMGNYNQDNVTTKTKDALTLLIAAKGNQNSIIPDATSTFKGKTFPNVGGHRDVGSTACPGDHLYAALPAIRTKASQMISEGTRAEDFSAEVIEKPTKVIMEDHSVKQITVKLKNIGSSSWTNNGDFPLTLEPQTKPSRWYDKSTWPTTDVLTKLQESRVTPGSTGTFTFTLRDSQGEGSYTDSFLVKAGSIPISGSSFSLSIQVLARYKAEVHSYDTDVILAPGDKKVVKIRLKNLGTRTWTNTGNNYAFLQVDKPLKRVSKFFDEPSWVANNTQPTRVDSTNVPPGYVGTFEFYVIAPQATGSFTEDFSAAIEGVTQLPGSDVAMRLLVKAPYSATVTEKPTVITSETNKSQVITVKMKNTGARTWTNTGDNAIALQALPSDGKKSIFTHDTWTNNDLEPGRLQTASVANGEIGTFTFFIHVPQKAGSYQEKFTAITPENKSLSGSSFQLSVTAEPPYAGEIVSRSRDTLIMEDSSEKMLEVRIRNTGTRTWEPGSTYIATDSPARRDSIFQHPSWGPYDYIATKLTTTVDPGEIGVFQIWFASPSGRRTTSEAFYAGVAGGIRIEGTEFVQPIQVLPRYEATVLSTNPATITMSPKEIRQVSYNIRNTGTRSWDADGPNAVGLYVTEPENRTSPFYDPTWSSSARPTRIDEPSVVEPGEYGTFRFLLNAPGFAEGFTEHYKLMADNIQWITGSDLTLTINVKYQKPQALLKIGVFKSSTVQITANGTFKAINANTMATHKQFSSGNIVSVTYESGQYHTTGPGLDVRTSSPVKFIPVGSSILEIKNMSDRPSWDTSLNDNRFRGNIIVQRSDSSGETWAINEIYMEHYLRGIAEQSNTTHATHLRTMAVIERTYAQYNYQLGGKHPELNFDLNNTSGDQVYKGYGFEIRSPNVTTAVDATRGQMVSMGGDVVVTPYFSQSDGRTRSWSEVWAGSQPHCISVPDPWSEGRPLLGHGVGLAAYGALKQAEEGKDYKTILKYYYTGINITDYY